MHNEHHSSHNAPGFGKNTNGVGILIVAITFVIIALFTWWLWNNNDKELDYYRIEGTKSTQETKSDKH